MKYDRIQWYNYELKKGAKEGVKNELYSGWSPNASANHSPVK